MRMKVGCGNHNDGAAPGRWSVNSWLAAIIASLGGWLAWRLWTQLAGIGQFPATRESMGDAWVGFGRLFNIMGTLTFGIAPVVVVGFTVLLVVVFVTVALVRNERCAWVPWVVAAVGLAAALCLRSCENVGDKPARRVVMVWCGDGSFHAMGGVELVRESFGRRVDRTFWALGEKDAVVREEPDPKRRAFYFETGPRGLEALGEAIQADYRAFAGSGRFRGAESYELRRESFKRLRACELESWF